MVPTYIRTPEDFATAITIGVTTESLVLDFKKTFDTREPDAQKEMCRDIAQFANTDGGCVLIGIPETTNAQGIKVAKTVKSVKDPDKMREQIEQAIANHLVPSTLTHDVAFIPTAEGVVVAVNVPPSRHTVHVWDREKHTMECLYRTNHGKAWMNPDEMERHMMNGSRAARPYSNS